MVTLPELFDRQRLFQSLLNIPEAYLTPDVMYRDMLMHISRCRDELSEAVREIPYSFGGAYKSSVPVHMDKSKFLGEIVDAFLFMVNTMNIAGITSDNFLDACERITNRNVERIKSKERFTTRVGEYPIVMIEGPDGVGKTTIAKQLSERYGVTLMTMPKLTKTFPGDRTIEHDSQVYNRTIDQIKMPLILDRGFPSSMVYSKVFRRDSDLNYLKELFQDRETVIFIIDREEPFRGDDWFDAESEFGLIRNEYLSLAKENEWAIINNSGIIEFSVQAIISKLRYWDRAL